MKQISSWGLALLLLFAMQGTARADDTPTAGTVGLGLTIGGAATALVSGTVLLASYTCRPDPHGEGCPPPGDRTAAAVAFIAGVLSLGVGLPMYLTSGHAGRTAGSQQANAAINSLSMRLVF
jgi:hypothetical protein